MTGSGKRVFRQAAWEAARVRGDGPWAPGRTGGSSAGRRRGCLPSRARPGSGAAMLRTVLGTIRRWTGRLSLTNMVRKVKFNQHKIIRQKAIFTPGNQRTIATRAYTSIARTRSARGGAAERWVARRSGDRTRRAIALSRVCRRAVPAWSKDGSQYGLFATKSIQRHTLLYSGVTLHHDLHAMNGYSSDGHHTGLLAKMMQEMSIVVGAGDICWDLRPQRNDRPVERHLFYVNEASSRTSADRRRTNPVLPNVRWYVSTFKSRHRLFVRTLRNIPQGQELLLQYNLDN